ncbi:MAG: CoB--CoM heterodisulfide reductase subunit C [Methanomassiliicoccales archaeon]
MSVKVPNPEFTQQVIDRGGDTVNLCFQCGTCTASCPSGRSTAFKTRQLVRKAQLGLKEDILDSNDLWMCTTCYTCTERCPRGVEIVDIIMALRNIASEEGHMFEDHKKVSRSLIENGHTVALSDKYAQLRKDMGLPEKPPTVLSDEKSLADFQKLMEITGFKKLVGGD